MRKSWKVILGVGLSGILILAALAVIFYPRVLQLTLMEWKYSLGGDDADLIRLCYWSVEEGDGERMARYLPEALAIEDFDGSFEKSGLGERRDEYGFPYDAEEIYTMFLAGKLFSTLYTERYDEFTAELPALLDELIGRSAGADWCATLLARTDRITPEGYDFLIQSLGEICPERPEVISENVETAVRYISIKDLIGLSWHYRGDDAAYQRILAELAELNIEAYANVTGDRETDA